MANQDVSNVVSDFYGELNNECKFKSRVNAENLSPTVQAVIGQLHEETMKRYYGSGIRIPDNLEGARVLDLGCGSGSLVFIFSKLVGPTGYVVGVDFTSGLVENAKEQSEYHWKKWGYEKANFEFHCANIENVSELGFPPASFDIVVSNCVFCMCPNKEKVFEQAFKMLKPGGMFQLGDVYGDMKQPDELKQDKKLWCMGTSGAMLWNELSPMAESQGLSVPYLVSAGRVDIKTEELKKTLSNAQYMCAEWKMFKPNDDKEKKGTTCVKYLGNVPDHPDSFRWDIDLEFKKGEPVAVDGVLATILSTTAYSKNFEFEDCDKEVVVSKRNQNPFQHVKEMEDAGQATAPRYTVD